MDFRVSDSGNPIVDYLTISKEAGEEIKKLLNQRDGDDCEGIKIGVKTRGCSGLSYKIEYAIKSKNISKFDDLVEYEDAKIFIDPKISMFLIGSEMVYKSDELTSGFDFVNPNEKGRCGCGESFKV